MNKKLVLTLIFALVILISGCNLQAKSDPEIATVNGEKITQSEFDQHYNLIKNDYESRQGAVLDETQDSDLIARIKSAAFDDLVLQKLVRQDAQKQGIEIDPAEVDSILNEFKQSKDSAEADGYKNFLDQVKMTEKDLRAQVEISQLYDKLQDKVVNNIEISDEEAQKYYDENPALFQDEGGIQIYHILVDTEPKANEILDQLKQGGDFAALAQQYSIDSGSKDQGGDVGAVNENTNFVAEFKQVALTLQPGQLYQQPVKTTYGYHIIKAGDKKAAAQLTFAQVKDQLKLELANDRKTQTFNNYLEQLKNNANINDLRQK
ncbi:MAG: peptidylprolyl isomerase [Syntrophomonadaceae bacterium]|nr:peptidylprolyl isomerase [Syntrophomonadaceae bacterium]